MQDNKDNRDKPPNTKWMIILLVLMLAYCYMVMYGAQLISTMYFEGKAP